MPAAEYACVFVRPPRERLALAARLAGAIPAFLGGAEGELDLHHCLATGYTAAVVRAARAAFSPEVEARLAFWSARAGARVFRVDGLSEDDRSRFRAELGLCERVMRETALRDAAEAASRFFGALGVAGFAHASGARAVLSVDLDGPGATGLAYTPGARSLFIAGVLAPPVGDELLLSLGVSRASGPVEGWARVVAVRGRGEAAPGRPAGFTLRIEGPQSLHTLLAEHARVAPAREDRATPRFPVHGPVKVARVAVVRAPAPAAAQPPRPAPAEAPRARIEYTTDQELAADWIENLSHGGAFVRTAAPHPEGTEVAFELALPDGVRLEAKAVVAFVNANGMGLRFVLSPEEDQLLSAAIARISARPKRALVVDDDPLARMMIGDALRARGFEVLTAEDAVKGLHALIEEILALDLLVTDVFMPGIDGDALIRTVRQAGGEAELAIVAVTGSPERCQDGTLEAAGADAVLDKAVGAELIARAADAVLERKRLVRRADAA
jgi:uncharacterized protein (TIGR02266 family)